MHKGDGLRKIVLLVLISAAVASGDASAEKSMTRGDFVQLFQASFSYMAVVKACEMKSLVSPADAMVQRVVNYGYRNNLHDEQTLKISQNLAAFTKAGMDAYKKDRRISCQEAEKYVNELIRVTSNLK